ncbi:MAG TPA: thioredoxin family protein [Propionibacteriaceae bacterium]
MDLEVLHIADCPNWELAGARLREALISTGHGDVPIKFRLLRTAEDTAGTGFAGSPTITVDGTDLFPSEGSTSNLACRIYSTSSGLAGLPTVDDLIEKIQADERWSQHYRSLCTGAFTK